MNDLEQLTHIIQALNKADAETRAKGHEFLRKIRDEDINKYTDVVIQLLQSSSQREIQRFCLVHLRVLFSNFVDDPDNKWTQILPEHQKHLKQVLIDQFTDKNQLQLFNPLCELIGDLAATIHSESKNNNGNKEDSEWDLLDETLSLSLDSEDLSLMGRALRVFSVLYERCPQNYTKYKEKLFPALERALSQEHVDLKVVAMKTFYSFITMKDHSKLKSMKDTLVDFIRAIISETKVIVCDTQLEPEKQYMAIEALGTVADIIEFRHELVEKNFDLVIETVRNVLEKSSREDIKLLALEIYVLTFEKLPKAYQENPEQSVKEAVDLIFKHMVTFDQETTKKWENATQEDFFDDFEIIEAFDAPVIDCRMLIGRVLDTLSKKRVAPSILKHMVEILKVKDWQTRHCALLCIGEIIDFIEDPVQIDPIVFRIMGFLQSDSPKVIYAAVQCLGQIADNAKVNFQENHARTVLPSIVFMLTEQPPRIICWSLRSLAGLVDGCKKDLVLQFADSMLELCNKFVGSEDLVLVHGALEVIYAIARVCEAKFDAYHHTVKEAILPILDKTGPKWMDVKEDANETLRFLDEVTGKHNGKAKSYLPEPVVKPPEKISKKFSEKLSEPERLNDAAVEKMVEVPNSDMGDVSTDYEVVPLAQTRARRGGKKIQSYEEKPGEEQKENLKDKSKRQRITAKKTKDFKVEEEETKMEVEKPSTKPRTEIAYEWREWQLAFKDALGMLTQEEFITFVKIVQEDKPECVSFEKGYLELKISAAKVLPPLSENPNAKTNQMMIQIKTFIEFIGYIEKIKGNSNLVSKPKTKKGTRGK